MRTRLGAAVAALLFVCGLLVPSPAPAQDSSWLDITLDKSMVLTLDRVPESIAITDPAIANPVAFGNTGLKFLLQGLELGNTDFIVQYQNGEHFAYNITVHRDLSDLVRTIDDITQGTPPRIYPLDERIVVQGPVTDLDTLEQVALMTRLFDPNFVNLMTVEGDHQVQLEVVFAEVSRSGLRDLGVNLLWDGGTVAAGFEGASRASTSLPADLTTAISPGATPALIPGMLQVGGFVDTLSLGSILTILSDYKLGKLLSRPTVVTLSGQQGTFQAGGQIPIPITNALGATSVTMQSYGVQLEFTPTVLGGNVIDMQVKVQVSEVDKGTSIGGIPGLLTRQGASHLRLASGMTFAMAGILTDRVSYSRIGAPGLSRIPVLGVLFRTVQHFRSETELVIFVTPRLVRPLVAAEVPAYPGTNEGNHPGDIELYLLGMDHAATPMRGKATPSKKVGMKR